jgi:2,4-dienoyl-CoA reductase-like NADH-dependent reductase (Old Yellow Enzyme family)
VLIRWQLYYKQRAEGRCGLILNEGTLICQQGTEWPHAPGIWSEEQVQGWKAVTDAVHGEGGVIFCQLWHVGRVAHPDMPEQKAAQKVRDPHIHDIHNLFRDSLFLDLQPLRPVEASSGTCLVSPAMSRYARLPLSTDRSLILPQPTELSDPRVVIEEYRKAAVNAKKAGFDGVERTYATSHMVHGH